MKTESGNLSAQESLDIITEMIRQAKGNAQKNGFHFMMWGWIVVVANLGMYTLSRMGYSHPYIVWIITIPAWFVSLYVGYKHGKSDRIHTHLGTISAWLWVCFGLCIFTFVGFGYTLNYQMNPLILTMSFIPTFVSGVMLRFRPLMIGGAALWLFGILSFLLPRETQPLIGALAVVCG